MRSLIFGNGVSIRFSKKFYLENEEKNEYSWEMIAEKFISGIDDTIELCSNSYPDVYKKSTLDKINEYYDLNKNNVNESFLWDIFKIIVINNIETKIGSRDYLKFNYKTPEEIWNKTIKIIGENIPYKRFSNFCFNFSRAYYSMMYALARSICINYDRNEYIKIIYSENWIKKMEEYNYVYTTNYFVGTNKEIKNKIIFLHGKFENSLESLNQGTLDANDVKTQEFLNIEYSNILFGRNYEDKVILNSMLNWFRNPNLIKKVEIIKENIESNIFDVVGLSVEGDKDFFKYLIMRGETINIFYHSKKDKKNWTNFIKEEFKNNKDIKDIIGESIDSKKINIVPDTLFEGFKED
ncbi:MAG: hypothetical protein ACRDA7_01315 [Metamycoplasmataceae bacterium]